MRVLAPADLADWIVEELERAARAIRNRRQCAAGRQRHSAWVALPVQSSGGCVNTHQDVAREGLYLSLTSRVARVSTSPATCKDLQGAIALHARCGFRWEQRRSCRAALGFWESFILGGPHVDILPADFPATTIPRPSDCIASRLWKRYVASASRFRNLSPPLTEASMTTLTGAYLAEQRQAKGLTRGQLAAALGYANIAKGCQSDCPP